jgi:hypothetical protein
LALTGDREEASQAANVVGRVYAAMRQMSQRGDNSLVLAGGGGICDLLSADASGQTIEYARRSSGRKAGWTCQRAVALLGRSQRTRGRRRAARAKIVGVTARGDRATASVRFGKGSVTSLPLVKEGGEWRLAAAPTAQTK